MLWNKETFFEKILEDILKCSECAILETDWRL